VRFELDTLERIRQEAADSGKTVTDVVRGYVTWIEGADEDTRRKLHVLASVGVDLLRIVETYVRWHEQKHGAL
jgi:hypothetical protein